MVAASPPMLAVENLVVEYPGKPPKRAVDDVAFSVDAGESVGIVGGSGSGKTTIAKALVGLEPAVSGRIVFEGVDLLALEPATRRNARRGMQLVFQDTLGALNPRMRVGDALREVLAVHRRDEFPSRASMDSCTEGLLDLVELQPDVLRRFPHEISGGQRQRIGIARALAANPRLLIADEPVSALDVAVQAQMMKMLRRLLDATGLTMIFIAHDLAVVSCLCDRAVVMDAGRIVEQGDPRELFANPQTEFVRSLVEAVPDVSRAMASRFGR